MRLMITVILIVVLDAMSNVSCQCANYTGLISFASPLGHCYYVPSDPSHVENIGAAKDGCANINASLLSVTTPEEMNFLLTNMPGIGCHVDNEDCSLSANYNLYYLGLRRNISYSDTDDLTIRRLDWHWEDGSPLTWTNWATNEPENGDEAVMNLAGQWLTVSGPKYNYACKSKSKIFGGSWPPSTRSTDMTTAVIGNDMKEMRSRDEEYIFIGVGVGLFLIVILIITSIVCCGRRARNKKETASGTGSTVGSSVIVVPDSAMHTGNAAASHSSSAGNVYVNSSPIPGPAYENVNPDGKRPKPIHLIKSGEPYTVVEKFTNSQKRKEIGSSEISIVENNVYGFNW